ncbi:MAG: hypothetical protein ABIP17_14105 [Ilumatobacteraceae bacterium]
MPIRRRVCDTSLVVAGIVAALVMTGCSRDGQDEVQSDAGRFCGEAIQNRDNLVAPPLGTEAEVTATLDFYRLMGALAPVGIATEWNDVVVSLETASTLVVGDPQSEQIVAKTAYAAEPSAFAVKSWLQDNCGLDVPITTIAPQEPVPAMTTTIAPTVSVDPTAPTTPPTGG